MQRRILIKIFIQQFRQIFWIIPRVRIW